MARRTSILNYYGKPMNRIDSSMQLLLKPVLCVLFLSHLSSCTIIDSDAWPANHNKIILSFDDGPSQSVSTALLNVLAEHRVKATFFYVGRNVKLYPEIVKRAASEGHEVAVHSYSRRFPTIFDYQKLVDDVQKTRAAIRRASENPNLEIGLYRPPSGMVTPTVKRLLNEADLKLAYINFYARDSALGRDKMAKLLERMKSGVEKRNGGSIIFHESRFRPSLDEDNTVDKSWLPEAVDDFIIWAKSEGYTFVLFDENYKT
ncbi:MAG: polysaccharide deacetylase family protein [Cellvibrionaceae bacterium]